MDINKNYYNILEVKKNDSDETIKKSYRKLAIKYHPDKNPTKEAEERFKLISEANSVLSDKKQKNEYDRISPFGANYDENYARFNTGRGFNEHDIFKQAEQVFRAHQEQERKMRELAVMLDIEISMEEIYNNKVEPRSYKRRVPCQDCNGFGFDASDPEKLFDCGYCDGLGRNKLGAKCHNCHGYGQVSNNKCKKCKGVLYILKEETINIPNPMQLRGRQQLQQSGAGHYSSDLSDVGPLIVDISLNIPEDVEIRNGDIFKTLNVHYQDAIDGSVIVYAHYDNKKYNVTLKSGTNNGDKLKLSGKGLLKQGYYGETRGDLIFIVNICIDYERLKTTKKK